MTRWGPLSRRAAFTTGAAVIVGLPGLAQLGDGDSRLGWEMFAGVTTVPEFETVSSTGARRVRPTSEYAARLRPQVDYAVPVARWICAHEDDVVTVRVVNEKPSWSRELACGQL